MHMKTHIIYFRAEGTTAKDDRELTLAIDADLFEIKLKKLLFLIHQMDESASSLQPREKR